MLTCVSYGVLYGFDRLFRKKEPDVFFAKLTITRQGKTVTLPAKIDTGLTLTEPFSGTPAIVADRRALGAIYRRRISECKARKMLFLIRLIPFSSLGADGVLPAFRPDAASLSGISIECWVAVTDRTLSAGSFQALVGAAVCDAAQIQGLKPGKDIPWKHDFLTRMREIFAHFLSKVERRHLPLHKRPGNASASADESGRTGGFSEYP